MLNKKPTDPVKELISCPIIKILSDSFATSKSEPNINKICDANKKIIADANRENINEHKVANETNC